MKQFISVMLITIVVGMPLWYLLFCICFDYVIWRKRIRDENRDIYNQRISDNMDPYKGTYRGSGLIDFYKFYFATGWNSYFRTQSETEEIIAERQAKKDAKNKSRNDDKSIRHIMKIME